jgi:hypothetical protein
MDTVGVTPTAQKFNQQCQNIAKSHANMYASSAESVGNLGN